jgi:hypothetical protein
MKPLIAIPRHDGRLDGCTVAFVMTVVREIPGADVMFMDSESDIVRARNDYAAVMLEDEKYDGILFCDSDIDARASHAARLIAHKLPIVGGVYPKKRDEGGWVWLRPNFEDEHPGDPNLISCDGLGTGFMWISREVFEALKPHVDSCLRRGKTWWNFFDNGIVTGPDGQNEYLSEDYGFCWHAKQQGYKTWVDRSVRLGHRGSKIFRG